MMMRTSKYLKKKKLQLIAEKSKIVYFGKGESRRKKTEWKWEERRIEEVSECKYLDYTLKKNKEDRGHIRELKKKSNIIMRKTWRIGERKFNNNFEIKMWLFRYLVLEVVGYGAEV